MDGALHGGFELLVVRDGERAEFSDLPLREVAAHLDAGGFACSHPKMHCSVY
jgi:hypothetical protein